MSTPDEANLDVRDPVAVLQALIRYPSVTPESASALDGVAAMLAGLGLDNDQPVFSAPDTPDIANLFSAIGSVSGTNAKHFAFAGHLDVVPEGDANDWSHDPFAAMIEGGKLYGRGAVDMKGGVAAMIAASARFLDAHGPDFGGRLSFILTGDEEGPAVNGTDPLMKHIDQKGERIDACLLGEPTNPETMGEMIKVGRRGSLTATITVEGVQGHVAYPHLAANPLTPLVNALAALKAPLDEGTDLFQPSNLEPVTIDTGNPATNVIPQRASARVNVRFNSTWTKASLEAELRGRLDAVDWQGCSYELAVKQDASEAFYTPPGAFVDSLVDAIEAATGITPKLSTSGGTSDARFIKDYCPVVEFGLVGQTMHQVDEHVEIAHLEALTDIYGQVLERFFER
ncbi:succinyl-diaminopimelate desuccinylase [Ahrensia marina]|uniref:succinyl-diaminopimelate desuccinylase n=1 Tax=Ahrensia marina TaxID=1514904 RepID=UPI0035CF3404